MTSNITSAFHKTGSYPLDRDQLIQKLPTLATEENSQPLSETVNGLRTKFNCLKGNGKMATMSTVIQSMYVAWLKQFHPESNFSLSSVFSSVSLHLTSTVMAEQILHVLENDLQTS